MKQFNIYHHPSNGYEAVKVGFSWPAFFFGLFWIVYKRLWLYAVIWFCLYLILSVVEGSAFANPQEANLGTAILLLVGYTAAWLIPGFKGNGWRETNLRVRGFKQIATIEAGNPEAAIAEASMDNAMRSPMSSVPSDIWK